MLCNVSSCANYQRPLNSTDNIYFERWITLRHTLAHVPSQWHGYQQQQQQERGRQWKWYQRLNLFTPWLNLAIRLLSYYSKLVKMFVYISLLRFFPFSHSAVVTYSYVDFCGCYLFVWGLLQLLLIRMRKVTDLLSKAKSFKHIANCTLFLHTHSFRSSFQALLNNKNDENQINTVYLAENLHSLRRIIINTFFDFLRSFPC